MGAVPAAGAERIYADEGGGVVAISASGVTSASTPAEYLRGEAAAGTAMGSGFEVDSRGDVLTNWHVVNGASRIRLSVAGHPKALEASLVARDTADDLVLLRIPTPGLTLHALPLGDSSAVQVGEPVLAIGNPFGYGRTLTSGIVSGLERAIQAPNGAMITGAIQTDAPIDPGSSGGPLLNMQGQVVGINSQIVTSGASGGYAGISFAIPINAAKAELAASHKGGIAAGWSR